MLNNSPERARCRTMSVFNDRLSETLSEVSNKRQATIACTALYNYVILYYSIVAKCQATSYFTSCSCVFLPLIAYPCLGVEVLPAVLDLGSGSTRRRWCRVGYARWSPASLGQHSQRGINYLFVSLERRLE
ncbi:unnamed protein product [Boreogadus saida]